MIFLWVALGWTVLIILILTVWNLALKYGRRGPGWDDDWDDD